MAWSFVVLTIQIVACAFFSWDAVTMENKYELYAFLLSTTFITLRITFEYFSGEMGCGDHTGNGFPICTATLAAVIVFQCVFYALAYNVKDAMGWRFYREFGADASLESMYQDQLIFLSLKKVDFSLALIILATGILYTGARSLFTVLMFAFLLLEMFWFSLASFGVHRESNKAMLAFFLLSIMTPINVFIMFVDKGFKDLFSSADGSVLGTMWNTTVGNSTIQTRDAMAFQMAIDKFVILAVVSLVVRFFTVICGIRVFFNFGGGLKERVFAKERHFDALGVCFPPLASKGGLHTGGPSEEKERDTVALRSL